MSHLRKIYKKDTYSGHMKPENVNEFIQHELNKDQSIKKDLKRKVINIRGLANHLKEHHKLETSLDAIISAIRRFSRNLPEEKLQNKTYALLKQAKLTMKTKMALITLKRADEVKTVLGRPDKIVDYQQHDTIRVLEGSKTYQFIIDRKNLENLKQQFPKRNILHENNNVGMIEITYPEDLVKTPGVFSLISQELAQHDISISAALIGTQEHIIVVNDDQVLKAAELIYHLS